MIYFYICPFIYLSVCLTLYICIFLWKMNYVIWKVIHFLFPVWKIFCCHYYYYYYYYYYCYYHFHCYYHKCFHLFSLFVTVAVEQLFSPLYWTINQVIFAQQCQFHVTLFSYVLRAAFFIKFISMFSGITNHEEYSLVYELPDAEREKTLTLKRDKSIAKDQKKLDEMKRKLHTDDDCKYDCQLCRVRL